MSLSRIALATRAAGVGLLLLVLAPAGCGPGRSTGVVKGKVTFMNRPVVMGNVSFIGDQRVGSGVISRDGSYTVSDAPVGKVKVCVTVPKRPNMMGRGVTMPQPPKDMHMPSEMAPGGSDLKDPGNQVPVPDKYGVPETTPLEYTVTKGEQTFDIKISP